MGVSIDTAKALRSRWNLHRFDDLQRRCGELDAHGQWVQGFLPKRTLCLLAGESGLGKSPLACQLAVSVAAGVPFIGHPVSQTPVFYLDFENGLGQLETLVARIARHLELASVPEELLVWSVNDAPTDWGKEDVDV